jgi:recombination protein RecR
MIQADFVAIVMGSFLPKTINRLIEEFSRLPGIGPKSAQRLTMHLLHSPESRVKELSDAVSKLKNGLQFCNICWNISENPQCGICADPRRNHNLICVVEEILDVVAIEKTQEYKGVYHVLHGALSPVEGIGPEQLKINALMNRLEKMDEESAGAGVGGIEIILATNPGLEGETTAMYLMRLLKIHGHKITRIARGLPVGGDLDYADELTLTKALEGRMEYS